MPMPGGTDRSGLDISEPGAGTGGTSSVCVWLAGARRCPRKPFAVRLQSAPPAKAKPSLAALTGAGPRAARRGGAMRDRVGDGENNRVEADDVDVGSPRT